MGLLRPLTALSHSRKATLLNNMKTIIAGSRDVTDISIIEEACRKCGWEITEVVSGCARGVDLLGERWANQRRITIRRYPADWQQHGKRAGPLRNGVMARNADALVAVWDGESRGTKNMIDTARTEGLAVYVHIIRQGSEDQMPLI